MTNTYNFTVTGMSCGHCESSVKEEVNHIDGVTSATPSAQDGTLQVTADRDINPYVIVAAVDEAGYSATPVK